MTRSGIESADLYVSEVTEDSPEHRAGLLPGDRLLTLDERPIRLWATFLEVGASTGTQIAPRTLLSAKVLGGVGIFSPGPSGWRWR